VTDALVHLVVPDAVAQPLQPSGGNVYDCELVTALRTIGHRVQVHPVRGSWPVPDLASDAELARVLDRLPDDATVLVDGLVGLRAPEVVRGAQHLRLWLLVHLPPSATTDDPAVVAAERAAVTAATGVVATSDWTRRHLEATCALPPRRLRVALPGARPSPPATGTPSGRALLCVGALIPVKGQDVLVEALASIADTPWTCRRVGPLDRTPAYVADVRAAIRDSGLRERVRLTGALPPAAVRRAYCSADVLVLPSRMETFGMVAAEALAHGLPVVASDVGGVREALGRAPGGDLPGALVAAGDPAGLAVALRRWLQDAEWRRRLRGAARARRPSLPGWMETARAVAAALNRTPASVVVRT
jgi:glycosyltransferase involved in cell wall biosynthesis